MIDWLGLGAALAAGLLGSSHCALMCGGIAAGSGIGLPREQALAAALRINLARVASYALAGLLVGGFGHGLLQVVQVDAVQLGMRMAVGAVLVLVALRMLDTGGGLRWLPNPGVGLWRRLAPLTRRVMPARTPVRQLALGVLWGWLPCGLSGSLLLAAWFSADPLQGALLMGAFGAGTLLTMLPLAWSGARLLPGRTSRTLAGTATLAAGLLTIAAPWLVALPAMHRLLAALGCRTLGV